MAMEDPLEKFCKNYHQRVTRIECFQHKWTHDAAADRWSCDHCPAATYDDPTSPQSCAERPNTSGA